MFEEFILTEQNILGIYVCIGESVCLLTVYVRWMQCWMYVLFDCALIWVGVIMCSVSMHERVQVINYVD